MALLFQELAELADELAQELVNDVDTEAPGEENEVFGLESANTVADDVEK